MREAAHSKKAAEPQSVSKGVLALIVLVIVLIVAQFVITRKSDVKGAKTEQSLHQEETKKVEEAKKRLQGTLEDQVDSIKEQVTQLDPKDIAESSPQVQKLIEDLKNLQGVPKDQLKNTCINVCKSL